MTSVARVANLGRGVHRVNFDAALTRIVFCRCLEPVKETTSYPGSVQSRRRPPDRNAAEAAIRSFLDALGFDPDHPALKTTPRKTVDAFIEALTCGYETDPKEALGSGFPVAGSIPIVATDVPLLFMCPHHLTPARGMGRLAFFASDRAPGLSRINRLFDILSRRLVLQEDLTEMLAQTVADTLHAPAVVVEIDAQHTCVAIESFAHRDTRFVTRAYRGDSELIRQLEGLLQGARPA